MGTGREPGAVAGRSGRTPPGAAGRGWGGSGPPAYAVALATVAIGLGIGSATAFGQATLHGMWANVANSASPWLAGAFLVGALHHRPRAAAVGGLLTCVLEVVGYYATISSRGATFSHSEILVWGACALVGGPVLGSAAWLWRRGPGPRQAIGAAILPAVFVGEAFGYGFGLHYYGAAVLYVIIALLVVGALAPRTRRPGQVLGWFLLAVVIAVLGEIVLAALIQAVFLAA